MVELVKDELWNLGKVWTSVFIVFFRIKRRNFYHPLWHDRLLHFLACKFQLLLFAFGKPPLGLNPSLSFLHFLAVASFPVVVQHSETKFHLNDNSRNNKLSFLWNYIVKGKILILLSWIHQKISWLIYFTIIYFELEVILVCVASFARIFLGLELEPQFKDPVSSNSIRDFWGKRWNLMVANILRPTVYQPSLEVFTKIIGRNNATYPAVMSLMTMFIVSAIMHELIFYYLGRMRPTFEVTCFFLAHGIFVCLEITAKKHVTGKWEVPRWISDLVKWSFVVVSGFWLFLPPLLRTGSDSRMLQEYAAVCSFLRSLSQALW